MSILGVYKRGEFQKTLRVGTPDPTKYHDARSVAMEGGNQSVMSAKMPPNSKFTLPGVIIPRATFLGASRGGNHERPLKIILDPQFTNGHVEIDLEAMRRDPEAVDIARREANSHNYEDAADAIIEAYGMFAKTTGPSNSGVLTLAPGTQPEPEMLRQPPISLPGAYVVPKAAPGGGQVQPRTGRPATAVKTAAVKNNPDPVHEEDLELVNLAPCGPPGYYPTGSTLSNYENPSHSFQDHCTPPGHLDYPRMATQPTRQVRSLRDELESASGPSNQPTYQPGQSKRPLRRVVFELPLPGDVKQSLGRWDVMYHEVIREENLLVLVYDHDQPTQNVWFPPELEDPQTHEPLGIAVLVMGIGGEPDKIYRAYPAGIRFKYRNEELCIMTFDLEKVATKEQ